MRALGLFVPETVVWAQHRTERINTHTIKTTLKQGRTARRVDGEATGRAQSAREKSARNRGQGGRTVGAVQHLHVGDRGERGPVELLDHRLGHPVGLRDPAVPLRQHPDEVRLGVRGLQSSLRLKHTHTKMNKNNNNPIVVVVTARAVYPMPMLWCRHRCRPPTPTARGVEGVGGAQRRERFTGLALVNLLEAEPDGHVEGGVVWNPPPQVTVPATTSKPRP